MPEGDTIFRAARTLHRALAGKPVVRFESMFPALTRIHEDAPITGRTVERVRSLGKHVLMQFSEGLTLRTHMRMNGSWHIYRPGEAWRRPRIDMRIVVATSDFEAIGFNIPIAEFIHERNLRRHDELRRLGPDLLSEDFDETEAIARIRARPDTEIGEVLLTQRVMAGVGNVYKSEVLLRLRRQSVRPHRNRERRCGAAPRRNRAQVLTNECIRHAGRDDDLHRRASHDETRRSAGTALGLRPCAPALPPLRDCHPRPRPGRTRASHLLVSEVPSVVPWLPPSGGRLDRPC